MTTRRIAADLPKAEKVRKVNVSKVLVCGATGYVGGRLVPRLLEEGLEVRCLVRSPEKMADLWYHDHPNLKIIQGSLDDKDRSTPSPYSEFLRIPPSDLNRRPRHIRLGRGLRRLSRP